MYSIYYTFSMTKVNPNFQLLQREYIFPIIDEKLAAYSNLEIVNFGVGDIAYPLSKTVALAIKNAVDEMTSPEGMHGYGPSTGYDFLKEKIIACEYENYGFTKDEIFISDGINTDISNILELFHPETHVAIPDPAYPVYLDTALMSGKKITLLPCRKENQFSPDFPKESVDVIYLCSPSNPTGMALTAEVLEKWVAYALEHEAIILFDGAYEAFITEKNIPKSIYEIEGAKDVAVEFRSFSKSAGFTGLRCAYSVVPKNLFLYPLWKVHQNTKSNGVAYPIQRGAVAALSEGSNNVATYLKEAKRIVDCLNDLGYTCHGGINSPYIWWEVPKPYTSWGFFDYLLETCQILAIPGVGFGKHGEGYIRLSAFSRSENTTAGIKSLKELQNAFCHRT